jgi:hypothetical protein
VAVVECGVHVAGNSIVFQARAGHHVGALPVELESRLLSAEVEAQVLLPGEPRAGRRFDEVHDEQAVWQKFTQWSL